MGDKCCFLKDSAAGADQPTPAIVSGRIDHSLPVKPRFSTARPNLLFIVVDDLRPELGAFGAAHMHTPNIDALAARSLVLERAYAQQALCGPSRASFMTGRRPDATRTVTHGMKCVGSRGPSCYWRDVGAGNFTTLPQALRKAGWHAASFGKMFDTQTAGGDCGAALSWSQVPQCTNAGTGAPNDPSHASHFAVSPSEEPGLIDPPIVQNALQFLRAYNESAEGVSKPFFLAVGIHRPHLPFMVPSRLLRHYPLNMSALQPPSNAFAPGHMAPIGFSESAELFQHRYNASSLGQGHATERSSGWGSRTGAANDSMPTSWTAQLRQHYFSAVKATDELVGLVLDELVSVGVQHNTVISFIGDHGWHLSKNGLWGKCTNFESGTHVPLMIGGWKSGASIAKNGSGVGLRSSRLVEAVDLMPTLLDLAGVGTPPLCSSSTSSPNGAGRLLQSGIDVATGYRPAVLCREGVSLTPLLADTDAALKTAAFSQYPAPGCGTHSCAGADTLQHPSHMGFTMVTSDDQRITEWVPMKYESEFGNASFIPQWGTYSGFSKTHDSVPGIGRGYSQFPDAGQPAHAVTCPDGKTTVVEFYDHAVDPGETNNIAGRTMSPSEVAQVRALLTRLRAGWRAALVLRNAMA